MAVMRNGCSGWKSPGLQWASIRLSYTRPVLWRGSVSSSTGSVPITAAGSMPCHFSYRLLALLTASSRLDTTTCRTGEKDLARGTGSDVVVHESRDGEGTVIEFGRAAGSSSSEDEQLGGGLLPSFGASAAGPRDDVEHTRLYTAVPSNTLSGRSRCPQLGWQ